MKINSKDTKTILDVLNAYYAILSHKAHRSSDELTLFNNLQPLLQELNKCTIKESDNGNNSEKQS
tara:strand:- start:2081 stop:2275 length:195 start_codon:yes stop_codon:yes gene_type:complete